uniref:MIMI_L140_0 protein n=1 Tax=Fopius arisanus TaxID=64838 RepID=A0A0C9QN02_9HYME
MMLRLKKSFPGAVGVTTYRSLEYLLIPMRWRLWRWKNIHSKATAALEVDSTGQVKLKLDPRVEAMKDRLIYSDYIERKRLKFGYMKNKAIMGELVKKEHGRLLYKKLNDPNYSIALKYLKSDEENLEEIENSAVESEEMVDEVKGPKAIHMPYASTDQYEFKETEAPVDQDPEPILNTRYQKLYEKYLEAKETKDLAPRFKRRMDNLQKLVEGMEAKESSNNPSGSEMKRPADTFHHVPPNWMTDYEQYDDYQNPDFILILFIKKQHSIVIACCI